MTPAVPDANEWLEQISVARYYQIKEALFLTFGQ